MNLFSAPSVVVGGGGIATLRPLTPGANVDLGGADAIGPPATLGLTDFELDNVVAGLIRVGDPAAGDVFVSGVIAPAGTDQLSVTTGGTILNTTPTAGIRTVFLALRAAVVNLDTAGGNSVSNAVAGTSTAGDFRFTNNGGSLRVGAADAEVGVTANGGDVVLTADSGFFLAQPTAAPEGTVNLTSSIGPIFDENGAGLDVAGTAANISAFFDVGTTTDPIELAVGSLTAVSIFSGLFFAAADGLTLASLTGGLFGDVEVTAAAGDIVVGSVAAVGNNVTLAADAGNVLDDGNDGTAINAVLLVVSAARAIGAPGALADLDTAVDILTAATTGPGPFAGTPVPGIWVTDSNDLDVFAATTGDGVVLIDAGANLFVQTVDAGGTGRNVRLRALAGDLTVGSVTADGDVVSLSATGAIAMLAGGPAVSSGKLLASAGQGVGTAATPFETAVSSLAAAGGTGGVFVANAGPLTITALTAFGATVTGLTGDGAADVSAASPLTVSSNVVMGGDVTLTAGEIADAPAFADDLTVNPGVTVQSTGGNVALRAGDDVVLGAGAVVTAAGSLTVIAGFGDLDGGGGLADAGATLTSGAGLSISTLDDLTVGALVAVGQTVTLRSANGAVLDGNGGAANVTAFALAVQAATGIGAAADPLETVVARLEGLTDTGGLFVTNTGDLTVGGVTPDAAVITAALTGLAVATSGDLAVLTEGTLFLADTDGPQVVLGGSLAGDVSLQARGATADVLAAVDRDAVTAPAGSVTLTASRDVLLGTAGADFDNDLRARGSVTLTAGRDVTVSGFADVASDDFGADTGGGVTVTAGRDVNITDTFGPDASVSASGNGGGGVVITTGPGGTLNLSAPSSFAVFSSFGDVTVSADRVVIASASGITASNGVVTIQQASAGVAIDLGSATDAAAGTLELSDAELDRVFTPTLRIGDAANAGDVAITAPLTPGNATTLAIRTAGAIFAATPADTVTVADLALTAGTGIGPVRVDVATLAAVNTTAGAVDVTSLADLLIGTVDGLTGVANAAGPVALTAGAADATLTNTAAITGGPVALTADRMALAGGTVAAAGGRVTLQPFTAGRAIDLGSATDAAAALELSDAELDTITAGALQIGSATAGAITVSAPASVAGALALETGAAVLSTNATGADVTAGSLAIRSAGGIDLDTAVSNLAFENAGGAVDVRNTGALTIAAVDGLTTSSNTGTTTKVSAASPLTFAVDTTTTGDTTYTAGETADAPAFADDLTINSGVTVSVTAGNLTLLAGDDIILEAGSTATASGTVALDLGFGDLDGGAGSHGNGVIRGTVSAGTGTPTVTGGPESNALLVDFAGGATLPNGLAFVGGGGADTLTVSDAGDTINTHTYAISGDGVTRDGTTVSTVDVTQILVNGGELADTFAVTPDATFPTTSIRIDGNGPTPPAAPGDTLTVDLTGTTNPFLDVTSTATGFEGAYIFDGASSIHFTEIETLDAASSTVDLRAVKTGPATAVPGTTVTYTVVVSNVGSLGVAGVSVADLMPAGLTGATFTSTAAGGATGNTTAGSGDVGDTLTLPAGASVTYTITGTIAPDATGSLSNTATATAPDGTTDATPDDNTSTAAIPLTPTVDVQVTKTDGQTTAIPGTTVTYTVVVTNTGPSTAAGVTLSDLVPAGLTGVTWTSTAAGGAIGNTASGSGNVAETLTLPTGAAVTYTITGTVSPSATGTLTNTVTAVVAAGTTDSDPANNAATDANVLTPTVDVRVTKTGSTVVNVGDTITYTVVVSNTGPSTAAGVLLSDVMPEELTGVTWTSTAAGGATGNTVNGLGDIVETLTLPPGAAVTYIVTGTALVIGDTVPTNNAIATVPAGTTDTDTTNNAATVLTTVLSPRPAIVDQNEVPFYGVGTGQGGPGNAEVRHPNGTIAYTVNPLGADGAAGVRVAVADVTGDGVPDVVAGTGPGVLARFVILDGVTKQPVRSVQAFENGFTGGTYVAAADVNGDGFADVAVSADVTGGARVRVFDGKTGAQLADFLGIEDPGFRGGARVTFGDFNGDDVADLVVAAGFGGGPRIALYDGTSLRPGTTPVKLAADFFVFESTLRDGAYVAAGDLNGDGFDDLIAGGGPNGGPRVFAVDGAALVASRGAQLVQRANFFAADPEIRTGVKVAAKDFDADGRADVVVAVTDPDGPHVATFSGAAIPQNGDPAAATSYDIYPGLLSGVFVG